MMVDVTLSRVESLEVLYLTNAKYDFIFRHVHWFIAPSMKKVLEEYQRLADHNLPRINEYIKRLLQATTSSDYFKQLLHAATADIKKCRAVIIIINVNSQGFDSAWEG